MDLTPPLGWEDYFPVDEIERFLMGNIEKEIYPEHDIYTAFRGLRPEDVRVVIVGQDPYHQPNQAIGVAFGINSELTTPPPSLKNIVKELNEEGFHLSRDFYDLLHWRDQGVLLINTALTVERSKPNIHAKFWKPITENIIKRLSEVNSKVFVLWGNNAKAMSDLIKKYDETDSEFGHLILTSAHPSPLSARKGFFGNNHFNLINEWFERKMLPPINWGDP